ncbi:MAG TPA: response regulator [Cyanobacteria bacterium UBA11049]|nr:response regulator [Cyanobacteria bacterium UBA11049]
MQSTLSFSFRASELIEQLKRSFNETLTGYWQIELVKVNGAIEANQANSGKLWYIAVVQGRVICSGSEKLSWASFLETLKSYISRLQTTQSKQALELLKQELSAKETPLLSKIIVEMANMKLVSHDDVMKALRLKILSDLDCYLFDYAGQAQFIPEPELLINAPMRGFELSGLLTEAMSRQMQWRQLRSYVPSLDSTLMLKSDAIEGSDLSAAQKQQLQNLLGQGRTLQAIAYHMGQDPLSVAKIFANLIGKGLVEAKEPKSETAYTDLQPEIFIVDDSLILVEQFRHLVTSWGYRVNYSNNALTAVQTMLEFKPVAIFLDVNMPGASGFDLIKQIRRQPQISSLPLVLLTAEKTVSNQWRAQWASCKFLAKPRTSAEIPVFRTELRQMLEEIAPNANTQNSTVNSQPIAINS